MLKLDFSVNESIKRIVRADADVLAGMDLGAALSYKYVARKDSLSVAALYTESLGFAVSSVLSGTDTFFMCKKLQTDSEHFGIPPH